MAGEARLPGDDEAGLPLGDDELQKLALQATVALATPPGSVPPDPRPRRDALEEAYDSVLRLVREVRRLRRREERWKGALRASLAGGAAGAMKSVIEDLLDEAL